MSFNLKAVLAAVIVTAGAAAHAQPVPVVECVATVAAAPACIGMAVVLHELVQIGNGKEPLSNHGEGMKIVNGVGDVLAGVFGWGGSGGGPASQAEIRAEIKQLRIDRAPK